MKKTNILLLSFLAISVFAFSCKHNTDIEKESNNVDAVEDSRYIMPNEDYIQTRSFKDTVVENLMFGDWVISDNDIDQMIAEEVFGKKELTQEVYKKNKKVLLSASLNKVKKGNPLAQIEFCDEDFDEIIVSSFDFYIDGEEGFAIVSNDARIGDLLYIEYFGDINKKEAENLIIEEVSQKLDELKQIWTGITPIDCVDVLRRGYDYKGNVRGFFDFDWVWKVETKRDHTASAGLGRDRFMNDYGKLITEVFDAERNAAYNYNALVYLLQNKDDAGIEKNLPKKIEHKGTVFQSYLEHKGINSLFLRDGLVKIVKISPTHSSHYTNLTPIMPYLTVLNAMYINNYPVSYTYINKAGTKKTIDNIWDYFKSLSAKDDKTIAKRILSHLIYYIMSDGDNPDCYNKIYTDNKGEVALSDEMLEKAKSRGVDLSRVTLVKSDPHANGSAYAGKSKLYDFIPAEDTLNKLGFDIDSNFDIGSFIDLQQWETSDSYEPVKIDGDEFERQVLKDITAGANCKMNEHYYNEVLRKQVLPVIKNGGFIFYRAYSAELKFLKSKEDYVTAINWIDLVKFVTKKKLFTGTVKTKTDYTFSYNESARPITLDRINFRNWGILRKSSNANFKAISLPLKSADGKTLIDVMNSQKGIFELQEYNFGKHQAQQKQMKAEWDQVKKNETAGNTTAFYKQDPDSFATAKSSNGGKQKFETGSSTSVSKPSGNTGRITITRTKR